MFHWICPECGREIAPQAKECAACSPSTTAESGTSSLVEAAAPEAPAVRAVVLAESLAVEYEVPAPVTPTAESAPVAPQDPPPAPLQARVPGAPKPPASAVPAPVPTAGRDLAPVSSAPATAQPPVWKQALPEPQPARAPQIANAPLREPQPATLSALAIPSTELAAGPEYSPAAATLPTLASPVLAPPLAGPTTDAKLALSQLRPAVGKRTLAEGAVKEQISLPGPTLPHELTSLQAAGIAKILIAGGQQAEPTRRSSSWVLSFSVAALVLAGTLSAVFYAMPGLANSSTPPQQAVSKAIKAAASETPEPPPAPVNPLARIVEVAGIRFITDIPGRPPEIHYLVVNHSNVPLVGLTVQVTLRSSVGDSSAPLSQFAFKAPRLAPYESKEMVSSIERFNRAVALPNWRELQAEVQIAQ
ncbi:MAG: hypothetical protein ABIR70_08980 [Bryobacteraceae bacterium]